MTNDADLVAASRVNPVAATIRRFAAEAERERALPTELVSALAEERLFHVYTPTSLGGDELPLPLALGVIEEIARHDGSTGWVMALTCNSDVLTAALDQDQARELVAQPAPLFAGGASPPTQAVPADGGYLVSGT
jgi:alkylation response protein AidB-like acyl-CoA dehydrogenase